MKDFGEVRRIAVYSGAEVLGDGFFKLHFIRSLRETFPQAEIVWITTGKTVYAGILKALVAGSLTRVIEQTGLAKSPREILKPRAIGLGDIDLLIDTQTIFWRSLAVKRALRPRIFIAPAADYLLSSVKPPQIDPRWTRKKPAHFADGLMRLLDLASLGRTKPADGAISIPEDYSALAQRLLPEGEHYAGFAPGSGDATKRWPLERFIALARHAEERGRRPVFFIGPSERDMAAEIRAALPAALFPEDEAPADGPKGPLLVAALGRRLDVAVANDSGLGHMLAISNIPLILLYGRHSPAKYAPRTPFLQTVWAQDYGGPEHERIPLERLTAEFDKALAVHADSCAS
ncbi:MAG: lipopolysaccharide heptosyltransferase family protein [Alphaproteobacteria bacterium]|nr:lipopolysaccharide heptosyltransferase family protein [Alphaproteobacteria bacterium]MDX5415306.1 lipopolysaccharide heptosyltransferase family protein [Alphaproteobacteria bacterium]MDX5492515.1 lipopolysaccharide heptosyltransferase family protein [Alphaproteobacteria bacterium]